MGTDAWAKWLTGIVAIVVGVPVLLLYALYWLGARHLPEELPQASQSYPDATRALYWRSLSGRDNARIVPLGPVTLLWTASRLDRLEDARNLRHPAFVTLTQAARVVHRDVDPDHRLSNTNRHLAQAALIIRYSRERDADQLADLILDRSYYSGGVYGLEAAAQRNFGRTSAALSAERTLALLVTTKGATAYAPQCHPQRFRARYARLAIRAGLPATPQAIDHVMQGLHPIECR